MFKKIKNESEVQLYAISLLLIGQSDGTLYLLWGFFMGTNKLSLGTIEGAIKLSSRGDDVGGSHALTRDMPIGQANFNKGLYRQFF
jgi:hypothetical protein